MLNELLDQARSGRPARLRLTGNVEVDVEVVLPIQGSDTSVKVYDEDAGWRVLPVALVESVETR